MRNTLLRLFFHLIRLNRPRVARTPAVFLILQYRIPLGCCVHATPIYAALKAQHPDCTIIVATYGLGLAVLQHDPNIDHLLDTPEPGTALRDLRNDAQLLRRELHERNLHPTLILQDASNRRGTLALFALLLRLAPTRGFAETPPLYDEHLIYDPARSLIANNLRLVGKSLPPAEPAVYFTPADLTAVQSLLHEANPDGHPLTAIVVQGSGAQPNSWHDDRFAALIQHIESVGHRTVFLGTAAEVPAIDRVRNLARSSGHTLAGRTTIPQLTALLCLCDALITVDTGTMHVGRAAGVPMLVLSPSWQPAVEWLPLDIPNIVVLRGPDKPLARADIPIHYRLDEITLDSAIAAFTELDNHHPPSASARAQRVGHLLSSTRARESPSHPAT